MKKNEVLLFLLKYPKKGKVKKRLLKDLDKNFVTDLYKNFISDLLSTIEKLDIELKICFYPPDSERKIISWFGQRYCYLSQIGDDLGERMKNSFDIVFNEGYSRVVLIGSDIPDLPGDFIKKSFNSLRLNDVVIGPSKDGGYYLIGFKKESYKPLIFQNIKWSTETVFKDTMHFLKNSKSTFHVLPEWYDIDSIDDLNELYRRNQSTGFSNSKTMSFLMKYKNMFK
jgi:rSAM/selenodomain-associated transferase 1